MRTATIVMMLAAAILLAACATSPSGKATGSEPIRIGVIAPFTGDAASYGIPIRQAAELATEEINAQGGANGRKLELIFEDGACNPKGAATAAQKLVNVDGVKVILGGMCSGETLGAAPITDQNKVILFSPGSGSPDVTTAGDYVFRNFPSDATSASKVAKVAFARGDKRIAIISEQNDYSQAVVGVFKKTFKGLGGQIVADETFTSESSDFRAQLTKIKYANPDGVYVISSSPSRYIQLLKQLRELGIEQQLYTNEFASADNTLQNAGKEIEGAIFAEPAFDQDSTAAQELLGKFKAKYGELPAVLPPVYLATAYDATFILRDATAKCGEDTECIKAYLYDIKDRQGTAGTLSIDENGDAQVEYVVKAIKDGKVSELR